MLESDEAARRLGVKVATLYAYVSRGLLVSHPSPTGRRSLFDVDEVERLARRSRQGKAVETRMATITTGITQLTDDGPVYRGLPATDLATRYRTRRWPSGCGTSTASGAATSGRDRSGWRWTWAGPPTIGTSDRMRWAVVMAGAADPLRADLRPEPSSGRPGRWPPPWWTCFPLLAASPPVHRGGGANRTSAGSMAERLASVLTPRAHGRRGPGGQRGPGADGRPRAGHVDAGRAGGRLHPGRHLRRPAGRPWGPSPGRCTVAPASWPTPCWSTPNVTGPSGPSTTPCDGSGCCPASATPSTSTATPASGSSCELFEQLARPDQVELVRSIIVRRRRPRHPPAQRRPGPGRHRLVDRACRRTPGGPCSPWPGWPGGWPTTSRSWRSGRCATGPGPSTPPAGRRAEPPIRPQWTGPGTERSTLGSMALPAPHPDRTVPGDRGLLGDRRRDRHLAGRPGPGRDAGGPTPGPTGRAGRPT